MPIAWVVSFFLFLFCSTYCINTDLCRTSVHIANSHCAVGNCNSKYQLLLALVCWTWTGELSWWVDLTMIQ